MTSADTEEKQVFALQNHKVSFCQYAYSPDNATYDLTVKSNGMVPAKRPKKHRLINPINQKDRGSLRFENNDALRLFGRRMKEARELCNMSQKVAAEKLGYGNSSKLNKIEGGTDTSSVPLWVVLRAVNLYAVSADFLLGISDDWERDPVVSQERQVGRWLYEHWERAKIAEVNAIRVLNNKITAIEKAATRLLSRSKDNLEAVERVRELSHDEFDELRGGARLLRYLTETAEEAMGLSYELKRYRCLADVAKKDDVTVNLNLFDDPNKERLISESQAAKTLGIDDGVLEGIRLSGKISHVKIGKVVKYRVSDLRVYVDNNIVKVAPR